MMLEHSYGLLPSVCSAQSPTSSPPYVPVSHDWQPVAEGAEGVGQTVLAFPAMVSKMVGMGEKPPFAWVVEGPCQEAGLSAMNEDLSHIDEC
jgi:hypothetical protein